MRSALQRGITRCEEVRPHTHLGLASAILARRRNASGRDGLSGCCLIHVSSAIKSSGGTATRIFLDPRGGGPRFFFVIEPVDLRMKPGYTGYGLTAQLSGTGRWVNT
jgi:hypothetical protein